MHIQPIKPWATMRWVWLLVSLMMSPSLGQAQHPDARYPIPQLYSSVNQAGVNLATGDLNLEIPLAALQSHQLSYSLSLFYNSVSAGLSHQNNEVGGYGWKLMDYPKVVQDGSNYHFLDGKRSFLLTSTGSGNYKMGHPYHLWKVSLASNVWTLTTETGNRLTLGTSSTEGSYTYWHLTGMKPAGFDDGISLTYDNDKKLSKISCHFNAQNINLSYDNQGRLEKVRICKGYKIWQETVLSYDSQGTLDVRLVSLQTREFLKSGVKQAALPPTLFEYDSDSNSNSYGRLHKMVSGSGTIRTYKYYTGSEHPELTGKVIRYGTDNGYQEPSQNNSTPGDGDVDAGYSAIWYDTNNEQTFENTYTYFNKVKVYPGSFREDGNDANTTVDYGELLKHFGYTTYYFFNEQPPENLDELPSEYNEQTGENNPVLRGTAYQVKNHNSTNQLISKQYYIYRLESYNGYDIPVLDKSAQEQDGADQVAAWYDYEPTYYLPIGSRTKRWNPTKDDATKAEWFKTWQRYAFEDYSALNAAGTNQLTAVSQQYTAVAPGDQNSSDPNVYTITSASVQRWQDWNSTGWATQAQYVLKNEIIPSSFPLNLANDPEAANWLKTNEVTKRHHLTGFRMKQKDVDGRSSSTLYSSNGDVPLAQFYNAIVNQEATYLGFEHYEKHDFFSLSGGSIQTGDAHTGVYSYGGPDNIVVTYKAAYFTPKAGERYVMGAFIKLRQNSTEGKLCFGDQCKIIPTDKLDEWQYVYLITKNPPSGSQGPQITCNDCLVDDFRIHPLKASFSAQVFRDFSSHSDDGVVTEPGNYRYNHAVSVEKLALISGQRLDVKSGTSIRVEPGVSLSAGSSASLTIQSMDADVTRPWAILGSNGETSRMVFSIDNAPIAAVGPNEELRQLTIGYNAREGINIFGDSDPGDAHFDKNYPHTALQVKPRAKGSFWEGFEPFSAGRFSTLSGMAVNQEHLVATNTSAEATLNYTIGASDPDYAIYVEMVTQELKEGAMGLEIGPCKVEITADKIKLYNNGSAVSGKEISLEQLPDHLNLLWVVLGGRNLVVYANGRFLFDYTFASDFTGAPQLFATQSGVGFDNFMFLKDPVMTAQTFDAQGNPTQKLVLETASTMVVSETLYENHLNLPLATTRSTQISFDSDQRGLTFQGNFANLVVTNSGELKANGSISTMDGHNYDTPFVATQRLEADPTTRNDRSGGGGSFAIGTGNTTEHRYEANSKSNAFNFGEDDLLKQVSEVPHTSDNTVLHTTFTGLSTGVPFASQTTSTGDNIRKEQMEYDRQMRLTKHYQPKALNGSSGYTSELAYNFLGSVLWEKDPDGGRKQYAYDEQQRLRAMVDEEGKKGNYIKYWKYDALGRVIEEGIYNGYGSNVDLDDADDLQTDLGSNVNGASWPSQNDSKRRMKRKYRYDTGDGGNDYTIGRLTQVITYNSEDYFKYNIEYYTYDIEGNVVKHHLEIKNGTQTPEITFDYTYNQLRQPTQISLNSSGSEAGTAYTVNYAYDRLGRISMIGDGSDPDRFASYEYANGKVIEHLSNGTFTRSDTTNQEGLLHEIKYEKGTTNLFSERMYYTTRANDNTGYYNGKIASIVVDQGNAKTTTEYTYDSFGQLKTASSSGNVSTTHNYDYDLNGNLTSSPDYDSFNYDATNNKVTSVAIDGSTHSVYYNSNGRVKAFLQDFSYDKFLGLLNKVTNKFDAYYGASNQRVIKQTIGGDYTFYFHGLNDYPLLELKRNNNDGTGKYQMLTYVYGSQGIIAVNHSSIGGAKPTKMVSTATMETEFGNLENNNQGFERLNETRMATLPAIDHTGLPANITPEVARLNGGQGITQGPGKWLKVKAGDTVRAEVYAKYLDLTALRPHPTDPLMQTLFNGNPGGRVYPTERVPTFTSAVNPVSSLWAMLHQAPQQSDKAPRASLNYYLFDAHMQPLDAGLASVSTAAAITPATLYQPHEKLALMVVAQKNGYVYVDVSHDAPKENVDVYFDDLSVTQSTATSTPGTWYYLLRDHLGSTRAVADKDGKVLKCYDYNAYGDLTTNTKNTLEQGIIRYLYTGQEYEGDYPYALYNYRARIYSTRLGRFLQPDPAHQQHSAYAYVGNDPINRIDPDGEFWHILAGAAIGGTISAGLSIGSQLWAGNGVDWKEVGKAALTGAVGGAVGAATMGASTALLGTSCAAHVTASAISGAASSGASTVTSNALEGKRLSDGVATSMAVGAATGAVMGGLTSNCGCFTKGTTVKTPEGNKPIEDIRQGDYVWAYDSLTQEKTLRQVVRTFRLIREATYTLYTGRDTLVTTADHPYYNGQQWIKAKDLKAGDAILLINGRKQRILDIKVKQDDTPVFNFEVEGLHNYYVGKDGLLVHNTCAKLRSGKRVGGPKTRYRGKPQPPRKGYEPGEGRSYALGTSFGPQPRPSNGKFTYRGYDPKKLPKGRFPNFKNALYPGNAGKHTVTIKPTGTRPRDFRAANIKAGFGNSSKSHPGGYTWHHVDDRVGLMQLVDTNEHSVVGHKGWFSMVDMH